VFINLLSTVGTDGIEICKTWNTHYEIHTTKNVSEKCK